MEGVICCLSTVTMFPLDHIGVLEEKVGVRATLHSAVLPGWLLAETKLTNPDICTAATFLI